MIHSHENAVQLKMYIISVKKIIHKEKTMTYILVTVTWTLVSVKRCIKECQQQFLVLL